MGCLGRGSFGFFGYPPKFNGFYWFLKTSVLIKIECLFSIY